MSTQRTIRRYTLIIEKVGRRQFPSFNQIKEYLYQHDFSISTRTIQRDIEQIRFEFGIDIKYNRSRNGYYIDEENSINIDSFLRFLEIVNTADLLTESLKESKDTLNYISFESFGNLKGIEHLKPILFAIKNKRKLAFTHENFYAETIKNYTLRPYLLKEYQNRWYLVGTIEGTDDFRTFGIDRILQLELMNETFQSENKLNPIKLFDNTIGLTYSDHQIEEVILSFTPFQAKYIKSLPLHKSQTIIKENEHEVQIKLRIIPNFEFKQKILMFGENVTILKPKWLVDELLKNLTSTLKNYK